MSDSAGATAGLGAADRPERRERKERGPGRIRRIGTFYRQVIAELRKVIWPTRKQLVTYTAVVLVFVVFVVAFVALVDLGFQRVVFYVFG